MNFNNLSDRTKGIIFIILSAFGFAMMSAFVKLAGDLPSFQKTFFRNLVSAIVALILILKHKESLFWKKRKSKDFNNEINLWYIRNSSKLLCYR